MMKKKMKVENINSYAYNAAFKNEFRHQLTH